MELGNLEMQIIDPLSNPIWVEKFVNIRKHIEQLERYRLSHMMESQNVTLKTQF